MIAAPISVVIPAFNGGRLLTEAIRSVREQSRPALEILVVDDGSTDGSCEDLAADGETHASARHHPGPRLRVLRQHRAGTAAARNRGVAAARGHFLAFLDQDDLWLPDKLALQLDAFRSEPALDLVLGHVRQGEVPPGMSALDWVRSFQASPVPGYLPSALMVRRSAFERTGGFDTNHVLAESFDWFVRARERQLATRVLDETLVVRRLHGANKGRTRRDLRWEYARVLRHSLRRRGQ